MARPRENTHIQLGRAAAQTFTVNDRINQILIEQLDPGVWRARPPGDARSIAEIFAHMHNVRCKWIRLTAPHLKVPAQISRTGHTPRQVRAALAKSATRCAEMLAAALDDSRQQNSRQPESGQRVEKFRRDGWARPWPVGPEMLCYMLSHEAHHRGQVCMLSHQFGFPLPPPVTARMWNWEKLWKEYGFFGGPGDS